VRIFIPALADFTIAAASSRRHNIDQQPLRPLNDIAARSHAANRFFPTISQPARLEEIPDRAPS
jgi:hypothetical protein